MAQDTIEAIRSAELAAEQMEKDAAGEGDEVIRRAQAAAKEIVAEAVREAQAAAQAALATAAEQGKVTMANALREAEQELTALNAAALEKEPQAIQMILSELI